MSPHTLKILRCPYQHGSNHLLGKLKCYIMYLFGVLIYCILFLFSVIFYLLIFIYGSFRCVAFSCCSFLLHGKILKNPKTKSQKSQSGKRYKTVREENPAFMHEILIMLNNILLRKIYSHWPVRLNG